MMKLRPGDVIHAQKGRYVGRIAVLASAHRKGGMRVTGTDHTARPGAAHRSRLRRSAAAPSAASSCPTSYAPNRQDFQREVAPRARAGDDVIPRRHAATATAATPTLLTPSRRRRSRPRRAAAPRRPGRAGRPGGRGAAPPGARPRRSPSPGDFDRVLRILDSWGYVDGWQLTDAGRILARTFHECDLLIVEALRQGLLDDLEPAHLAGLVSVFVYEHRSQEPPPAPWFPSAKVQAAAGSRSPR